MSRPAKVGSFSESPARRLRLFVSHASADADLAASFVSLLERVSSGTIQTWCSSSFGQGGIQPGQHIAAGIEEQIRHSDALVVMFTQASLDRSWVMYEVGCATGSKCRVLPLLCGLSLDRIPEPLRSLQCYSLSNKPKLTEMLLTLLGEVLPKPDKNLVERETLAWCSHAERLVVAQVEETAASTRESPRTRLDSWIRAIKRSEISELVMKKMHDTSVKKVRAVTYTGEVDVGAYSRFHATGKKSVVVYTRSFLADLREQQEFNLRGLASTDLDGGFWNKQDKFETTEKNLRDAKEHVPLEHFVYDSVPSRRAFMFDDDEAITTYYQLADGRKDPAGSVYKGMADGLALWIRKGCPESDHLLDELGSFFATLQRSTRPAETDRDFVRELPAWRGPERPPCLKAKVVLLDMDGVLLHTLPEYVSVWTKAFEAIDVKYPETEVYLQEGREGRDTIRGYLRKIKKNPTEERVELVYRAKCAEQDRMTRPVLPGARKLLEAIVSASLEPWVVTGSAREDTEEFLASVFPDLIDKRRVITGRHVRAGKPDPDSYLLACAKAGVRPYQAIVIENGPLGIASAEAAGTFCIAANTGPLDDSFLFQAGARAVFRSCEDIAKKWPKIMSVVQGLSPERGSSARP